MLRKSGHLKLIIDEQNGVVKLPDSAPAFLKTLATTKIPARSTVVNPTVKGVYPPPISPKPTYLAKQKLTCVNSEKNQTRGSMVATNLSSNVF